MKKKPDLGFYQILDEIKRYSQNYSSLLVSCSGHADSIILLRVLCELNQESTLSLPISVIHFNYHLRGVDSDLDQQLVEDYCKDWGLPLTVINCSPELAVQQGRGYSFQDWARQGRLDRYQEWADKGCVTALGHHKDDLAETVLLRLLRGSSAQRLLGMLRCDRHIWRPFLHLSKEQLAALGKRYQVTHRHDRSNDTLKYSRNFIRNEVFPLLQQRYPKFQDRVIASAAESQDVFALAAEYLRSQIQQEENGVSIPSNAAAFDADGTAMLALEVMLKVHSGDSQITSGPREHIYPILAQLRRHRSSMDLKSVGILHKRYELSVNHKMVLLMDHGPHMQKKTKYQQHQATFDQFKDLIESG